MQSVAICTAMSRNFCFKIHKKRYILAIDYKAPFSVERHLTVTIDNKGAQVLNAANEAITIFCSS